MRIVNPRWVVGALVAALALSAAPARAQFAVVTLKSVDDTLDAVRVVMEKAGEKDKAKVLDAAALFLGGIDTKKPVGVYVQLPRAEGGQPPAVVFVPISKDDDFLGTLKQLQIQVSKPEKEVHTLTTNDGKTFYLRFANGHAYGSDQAENLEGKLPDPAKFMPAESKTQLLAATVRVGQLPKKMKQDAIEQMKASAKEQQQKKEGESEEEYQGRLFGMKLAQDALGAVILDSEDVSLSMQIDGKTDKFAFDLAMTAAPGTDLAANIKKFGALRSKFGSLAAGSAFNFICAVPLSADMRNALGNLFDKAFKEALAKESDAGKKKIAEDTIKLLKECAATDTVDFAAFLTGPYQDKLVSMVGALHIKSGKKAEDQMRTLLKDLPKEAHEEVKLDIAKVGNTAIHKMVPKEKADDKTAKSFGSNEIHVAFRDEAVLFTVGKHGLEAMKDALGKLDKGGLAKDTDPIQFEFSMLKLADLEGTFQNGEGEIIKKVFADAAKGKDRIRLSVLGGTSLRLRYDMSLEIIKMGAVMSKKEKQ